VNNIKHDTLSIITLKIRLEERRKERKERRVRREREENEPTLVLKLAIQNA